MTNNVTGQISINIKKNYSIEKNIFLKPDSANKMITGMLKHGKLFETNKTIPGVIAFTVINLLITPLN